MITASARTSRVRPTSAVSLATWCGLTMAGLANEP